MSKYLSYLIDYLIEEATTRYAQNINQLLYLTGTPTQWPGGTIYHMLSLCAVGECVPLFPAIFGEDHVPRNNDRDGLYHWFYNILKNAPIIKPDDAAREFQTRQAAEKHLNARLRWKKVDAYRKYPPRHYGYIRGEAHKDEPAVAVIYESRTT